MVLKVSQWLSEDCHLNVTPSEDEPLTPDGSEVLSVLLIELVWRYLVVSGDPGGQRTDRRRQVKSPDHPGGSDSSKWKVLVDDRFISDTCQTCHLIG